MEMERVSVEQLSEKMEGDRTVIIQEVTDRNTRQWMFKGERLQGLREQSLEDVEIPSNADVILVCDDLDRCRTLADQLPSGTNIGFLAGGYMAWGQFYHPVMVGYDEEVQVWQIHRLSKGCLSYLVVSGKEAIVIDPSYHIDFYLGMAHSQRTDIKCVIDTALHDDHVSGGARLAAKTTSPYYIPSQRGLQADSKALEANSQIRVGEAQLRVIPFSTGSSVGLLLNERFLFCGDATPVTRMENLDGSSETILVLPAHLHTLDRVNEHGIVATTLESWQGAARVETTRAQTGSAERQISFRPPQASEDVIREVNLSQRELNLDHANELDLGLAQQ